MQHQLQSIGRGFEGQGLSRALIEPQSNAIEVGLGEAREIGSSREVLSQQAVGVLIAATLPWTARITGDQRGLIREQSITDIPYSMFGESCRLYQQGASASRRARDTRFRSALMDRTSLRLAERSACSLYHQEAQRRDERRLGGPTPNAVSHCNEPKT